MSDPMQLNLERMGQSSRPAAVLTLISGLIVLGSLAFSMFQIHTLDTELEAKRGESAKLDAAIQSKQAEIARLEANRDQLNDFIRLIPKTQMQSTITGHVAAAQKLPARVYVHIAEEGQRKAADAAAARMRAAGFLVPEIENVGRKAPKPTQLRYFQRGDEQEAELDRIEKALREGGVKVRRQYVPPASGTRARPRHFEVWFGTEA